LYVDWVLAEAALLVTLAVYARRGARLARESVAGPIGTGMLLGMVGLGLAWVVRLPFSAAALWWERRHGLSSRAYVDVLVDGSVVPARACGPPPLAPLLRAAARSP